MYFPLLCLSILLASVASESLVKVGNFKNYDQPKDHGISGEVFVKDEKTLVIKGKACKIVKKLSVEYGNKGCGVGGTELESFLPKNQHAQRKQLYFENTGSTSLSKIGHNFRK